METTDRITYDSVGISTGKDKADYIGLSELLKTEDRHVLNGLGPFASLYDFNAKAKELGIFDPLLVLKIEEPGTKQLLAKQFGYSHTIGHDVINHLVNDIMVMGAVPLAVLDCIVRGAEDDQSSNALIKGFAEACKNNGCSLIGGETSNQPGVMDKDVYVLSASVAGVVGRGKVIDGSKIKAGDIILAVSSNGLHTNGYTLARKLMELDPPLKNYLINGETFLEHIMRPHTSYYKAVSGLLDKNIISGMAHITGGGIAGNLKRIIKGVSAEIDLSKLQTLPIFEEIQKRSNALEEEMLKTFNCGIGLIVITPQESADEVIKHISQFHNIYEIGVITKERTQPVVFKGKTKWSK